MQFVLHAQNDYGKSHERTWNTKQLCLSFTSKRDVRELLSNVVKYSAKYVKLNIGRNDVVGKAQK